MSRLENQIKIVKKKIPRGDNRIELQLMSCFCLTNFQLAGAK